MINQLLRVVRLRAGFVCSLACVIAACSGNSASDEGETSRGGSGATNTGGSVAGRVEVGGSTNIGAGAAGQGAQNMGGFAPSGGALGGGGIATGGAAAGGGKANGGAPNGGAAGSGSKGGAGGSAGSGKGGGAGSAGNGGAAGGAGTPCNVAPVDPDATQQADRWHASCFCLGMVFAKAAQRALGGMLVFAGISHLTFARRSFRAQVPDWVPIGKDETVLASGAAEIALGASLLIADGSRRA